ncbi:MAG TPA: hypothetical protein VN605_12190, partial [Thermoanaerobaculia bacterium]|nr:hypothetical protein [Thermoanaerobaculia bacterium]
SDYLPKREEGTLFPLPQIIVELIVTDQDRVKFDRLLDGGQAVFAKAPDFDETFRRLGLNEDASKITNEVDGRRNAADVAVAAGSDTFNVYKLLQALSALGLLRRAAKPEGTPEVSFDAGDDLASAGVADASDMWTSTSSPTFELDDSPSFDPMAATVTDLPAMSFDAPAAAAPTFTLQSEPEPAYEPPVPPRTTEMPTWDSPSPSPAPGAMPSWDDEPAAAPMMAAPPPIPMPPARPGREEWGGFDEAQIETARRAAVPVSSSKARKDEPSMAEVVAEASKPNRWVKTLLLAVLIVLVGFGGYAGFLWWQGRQPATTAELTPRSATKRPVVRPRPATDTVIATTTTATAATPGTTTTATTTATTATATHTAAAAPLTIAPTGTVAARPPAPVLAKKPVAPPSPAPAPVVAATRIAQTSTGVAITNNPVATPASDPQRSRYEAQARQHAAAPPAGNFTVQFELVCQTSSLSTAVRAGGERIWFVPTTYRGQSCYRVFWGVYDTQEAARAGAGELPASLRGGAAPVVVRIPR